MIFRCNTTTKLYGDILYNGNVYEAKETVLQPLLNFGISSGTFTEVADGKAIQIRAKYLNGDQKILFRSGYTTRSVSSRYSFAIVHPEENKNPAEKLFPL